MHRPRRIALLAGAALLAASATTSAQTPVPLGPQLQINTYTTNNQATPFVIQDGAGGFVISWLSNGSLGTDTSSDSVQARRFDAKLNPVGPDFQVNSYTTDAQCCPAISADGSGGFVVLWEGEGSFETDLDGLGVHGQRFSSSWVPVGEEFQVNTYTTGFQFDGRASPDGSGGFVVIWPRGYAGPSVPIAPISGQRYGSDGSRIGGEFQVNTYVTGGQDNPTVAGDGVTGFVVAWNSNGSPENDSSGRSILGRRFGSDGTPVGGDVQINAYTTGDQTDPWLARDPAGGFVIVWKSYGSVGDDSSGASIQARRLASDGSPLGGQFQVNAYTSGRQEYPVIASDPSGGFVVAWSSQGSAGSDTDESSIQVRRLASDGSPLGTDFQANSSTTGLQLRMSLAPDPAGGFILAWEGESSEGDDSSFFSVQARRFGPIDTIFGDDLESGDISRWSSFAPPACVDDAAEEDDVCVAATTLVVGAPPVSRNHCDADWVRFTAAAGATYVVETSNLVGGADTKLDVTTGCNGIVLFQDEDGGEGVASRVQVFAFAPGTFDVRVSRTGGGYGFGQGYDIDVSCVLNCP